MVMGALRDKIKIVILITLLAFVGLIFFDWGMQQSGGGGGGGGGIVGKVNGQDIPYETYRRTRVAVAQSFEQRTGRTAEASDQDAIEDETWLTLVQDLLLQEKIQQYGITLSDAEIVEMVKRSPPDVLRNHPDFQTQDGQFDFARYQSALGDPSYESLWLQLETYMRAAMPSDKLQTYLALNARVTTAEVRERFLSQNERVQARYVQSSPATITIADDAISADDLRAYYDAHVSDFEVGEQAILETVRISKEPTAQDSAAVHADLEDIREGILEGADFEAEAKAWSDDASAERGGDLGFFSRGDMPQPIEDAAFSLGVGQVSEVFASPFGYHVIKVEERKNEDGEEMVRARQILLRVEASNQTLRNASSTSDDFADGLADGEGFQTIAERLGLTVERTAPFQRNDLIPGVGYMRAAQRFAFQEKTGAVTTEPMEDERAFYLFRLHERRARRTLPFDEVQEPPRPSS
jgi:parvulin-like peptidyl-prolyl isomerase